VGPIVRTQYTYVHFRFVRTYVQHGCTSCTTSLVNWYFDIRETEYGWIKPENTVNVDEGGIMAGFGKPSTSTLWVSIGYN
jgi:hypothetical protein